MNLEFQKLKKKYKDLEKLKNYGKFSRIYDFEKIEDNFCFDDKEKIFNCGQNYKDKNIDSNSEFSQRIKKIKKFNSIKKL